VVGAEGAGAGGVSDTTAEALGEGLAFVGSVMVSVIGQEIKPTETRKEY